MGEPSRLGRPGNPGDYQRVRNRSNAGSFVSGGDKVAKGEPYRFKKKFPHPNAGDRFGFLTVLGVERIRKGVCEQNVIRVQCDCGAPSHTVADYNLRNGKSTRCNVCAKKSAGYWRKDYWGYAEICRDDAHRRRLLGRLSACINRCHNPNDAGYPNYGGRGITVYEEFRTNRAAFLQYVVGLKGWDEPRLELDRIDVNKGYQPGNLRFISKKENNLNKRSVKDMQRRIAELEACLRHCTCGATKPIHDSFVFGLFD